MDYHLFQQSTCTNAIRNNSTGRIAFGCVSSEHKNKKEKIMAYALFIFLEVSI